MSLHRAALLAVLVACTATAVSAQDLIASPEEPRDAGGWQFTPRLSSGAAWDDNVLIQGAGDNLAGDRSLVLGPGATLDYLGRRTELTASYAGLIQQYGTLSDLNSYEQSANVSTRRRTSPHTTLFTTQSYTSQPTTALRTVNAVPFLRVGSRVLNIRGGVEWDMSKRTSMSSAYDFEWIRFNSSRTFDLPLVGGRAHGGRFEVRHRVRGPLALTGNYDIQRATLLNDDVFTVQNSWAGVDLRLSENTSAFGAFGASRLDASTRSDGKTAPAWRTGFEHRRRRSTVIATYTSSFLPSYGAGGTLSNRELGARAILRLSRRLYTDVSFTRQSGSPLNTGDLGVTSTWVDGVFGYAAQPWLRVETFYGALRQEVQRPGGRVDRNRVGIQVVTTKPMRIR